MLWLVLHFFCCFVIVFVVGHSSSFACCWVICGRYEQNRNRRLWKYIRGFKENGCFNWLLGMIYMHMRYESLAWTQSRGNWHDRHNILSPQANILNFKGRFMPFTCDSMLCWRVSVSYFQFFFYFSFIFPTSINRRLFGYLLNVA